MATTLGPADLVDVGAFVFDVFGTVVDWRGSIIREGESRWAAQGVDVDWPSFTDAWRSGYRPAMERVRSGELPWLQLDSLHRMRLDELLDANGLTDLPEDDRVELNHVWRRIDPWPDSVPGLARLRSRGIVATLSNADVAMLTHMAKHGGLVWDCILSAELFRHYKPDPEVYRGACELLSLPRERVMMCAAHPEDLLAAARCGLRTALIPRPLEYRDASVADEPFDLSSFDVVVPDIEALAAAVGA